MQGTIKELEIEYEQIGKGHDVLLLHGWGGNIQSLKGVQELLAARKYRVTNISLPGFGNSEAPKGAWDLKDYVLFLEELILTLKLKRATVVGHSFGGKVSIKLAAECPDLISKLVLVNSSGIKPKNSLKKSVFGVFSKVFGPIIPKKLKSLGYRYVVGETDYINSGVLKETFKKIVNQHVDDDATQIATPTFIIWSEKDTYVPLWMGKRLNLLIPDSLLEVVEGATHGLPLTDPQKVSSLIDNFLK